MSKINMGSDEKKIVWTVSQDGGGTICGAYGGKRAKEKATKESGGKSTRMTYGQFRSRYPYHDVAFLDAK